MKLKAKNLIVAVLVLKFVSPVLAAVYFVTWFLQALAPRLYMFINMLIGFIPNLLDRFFYVETTFMERDVSMGYIYTACIFALFFYYSNVIIAKLEKVNKIQRSREVKKRLAEQEELRRKAEEEEKLLAGIDDEDANSKDDLGTKSKKESKTKNNTTGSINRTVSANKSAYSIPASERKTFFGLFEFQLKYYDVYGKDPANLHSLRREFSKIMVQKLQMSYRNIEFYADERIFFSCNDFSNFRLVTKDILTILRTFMQVGMSQSIKVGMFFSYWAGDDDADKNEIFQILNKINELGYLNKIIVSSGIYFRFSKEPDRKCLSFIPLGSTKLLNVTENGYLDIDLYSITKVE